MVCVYTRHWLHVNSIHYSRYILVLTISNIKSFYLLLPAPGVIQLADNHQSNVIDMSKGVEMTLNKKGRHVLFTYQGEQVAEIQNVRAKKLFPVAVFNGRAVFPLEIQYVEGPKSKDYLEMGLHCLYGVLHVSNCRE